MTKTRTKRFDNPRSHDRQNAFSGIKLAFLESYKDQFLESTSGAQTGLVAILEFEFERLPHSHSPWLLL